MLKLCVRGFSALGFCVLIWLCGSAPVLAAEAPLEGLLSRAEARRLWEHPTWHLLLHYRPDRLGSGVTSEADGPGFFLDPRGKTDPRLEMRATLAAFYSEETLEPTRQSAQCAFPARHRWLRQTLEITPAELPVQPCERLERWIKAVDPESVSLVYSSYFFNNPASMFGHTLLRFNKKGRPESGHLLDHTLNFAANVEFDDNGVTFAISGLMGGYQGVFSTTPYYIKVKEYSDVESRDLWEYRLSFTPEELEMLLFHTWEMGTTWFDYYFLSENCSYFLMTILEVARPGLDLTSPFERVTLPTDTIRVVHGTEGLVSARTYRPSRGSQYWQKLALLSPAERKLARELTDAGQGRDTLESGPFKDLPALRQALLVDTAIDFVQYRLNRDEENTGLRAYLRKLLVARSRLRDLPAYPEQEPHSTPPEVGHGPSRVFIQGGAARASGPEGYRRDEAYGEVSWRPAFRDIMEEEEGFAPNSQITLSEARLRYWKEAGNWRLEKYTLVDIFSLFPLTRLLYQPSWRFSAGWERTRDGGCGDCTPFQMGGGGGVTVSTGITGREVAYLMLLISLERHGGFERGHREGLGGEAGLFIDLGARARLGLFRTVLQYSKEESPRREESRGSLRITLSSRLDLRLNATARPGYLEAGLGLGLYY
ncbi:MAG: DUF4105 domain-containing protein [Deltaproteobacteria bacterium]|nr:DUF4105 domain-containing protein [Deltaproteobacteria bacterium]